MKSHKLFSTRTKSASLKQWLSFSGALILASGIGMTSLYLLKKSELPDRANDPGAQTLEKKAALVKKISELKAHSQKKGYSFHNLMEPILKALPTGTTLESVRFENKKITLKGAAKKASSVPLFFENLTAQDQWQDVALSKTFHKENLEAFELVLTLTERLVHPKAA